MQIFEILVTRFYDWIWWNIGIHMWKDSSSRHTKKEVERRLAYMKSYYKEEDE